MVNRQQLFQARANARLGANLAIARLQETVGPDTRVTAPIPNPGIPNNAFVGQAIDASAYKSDASGGLTLNPGYAQNIGYFISGDTFDPNTYNPYNADGTVVANHALLVGSGSVSDQDEYIAAPIEEIPNTAGGGAFAWWISDEGLKAQINITDEYYDSSGDRSSREQALTAQRSGSEAVLANFDPDNRNHNEILRRSSNLEQINLIPGFDLGPNVATENFHDVTLSSSGLPTNTRRGGLKRDLTAVMKEAEANGGDVNRSGTQWTQLMTFQQDMMSRWRAETVALENAGRLGATPGSNRHFNALQVMTLRADQTTNSLSELIFPPLTDLDVIWDEGGATWEKLLSWITLRQRRESAGRVTADKNWGETTEISPVIARVGLSQTLTLDYPAVTYHVVPIVVLWNPYNVPMRMDPSKPWTVRIHYGISDRENLLFRLRANHPDWSAPNESWYDHIPPANGKPRSSLWTPCFYIPFFNQSRGLNERFVFQIRDGAGGTSVTIPPGQALIFTMHRHQELVVDPSDGTYDPTIQLFQGLPAATGQFGLYGSVDIEDEMSNPNSLTATEFYEGYKPVTEESGGYHREAGVRRDRNGGRGFGNWQTNSTGGGNFGSRPQALPYPFPLDPSNLEGLSPSDLGYANDSDPAYRAYIENRILWDYSNPVSSNVCVNNTYLRNWNITGLGFEFGRVNNQQLEGFSSFRITLDGGNVNEPLVEIRNPTGEMPQIINHARLADVDNPNYDQIVPEIPVQPTPSSDTEPLPPDTVYGMGMIWGLRLPENPYQVDATAVQIEDRISGNTSASEIASNRWLTDFNPLSSFPARDPSSRSQSISNREPATRGVGGFNSPASYIGGFFLGSSRYNDLTWMTPDDLNQYIGTTDDTPGSFDTPRAIIAELPESSEDFTNPASMMSAPLMPTFHALMPNPGSFPNSSRSGFTVPALRNDRSQIPRLLAWAGMNYGSMVPAYALGNSRAHMLVDRGRAEQTYYGTSSAPTPADTGLSIPYLSGNNPYSLPNQASVFAGYDASWIYNEVLWDSFIFTPASNTRQQWANGIRPDDSPSDSVARDFTTSTENLLVNGAFNINSRSIQAWAILLTSMMGVDVGAGDDSSVIENTSAFTRFLDPAEEAFDPDSDSAYSPEAYGGYRRLTAQDIWDKNGTPNDLSDDTGLAVEIVEQVRQRGPFLSMSDFVNRALLPSTNDPDGQGLAGALQTAIDRTALNIAMGDPTDTDLWLDASASYDPTEFERIHPENLGSWVYNSSSGTPVLTDGSRNVAGASGELTQADILARIGSVLQARSDTFTIRAQGFSGNTDNPNARAWCEMTVQRNPEFIEDNVATGGNAPGDLPALLNPANLLFGRRFSIVAFRWLNEDEI